MESVLNSGTLYVTNVCVYQINIAQAKIHSNDLKVIFTFQK